MLIKFYITSVSAAVPKTNIGVNIFSGVNIYFRIGGGIHHYVISKVFSSGMTGSIGGSVLNTNWFEAQDTEKRSKSIPNMNNSLAQLDVFGIAPGAGQADLKFILYDKYNAPYLTIEKVSEPVIGIQAINFTIRGQMKLVKTKYDTPRDAFNSGNGTYWQWPPMPPKR